VQEEAPLPLALQLQRVGGANGPLHKRLVEILNTANISRLCSLKGIGKQRARKLVEMRQVLIKP
jgi:DNA uptake protein ComE-like DNA-binding protein